MRTRIWIFIWCGCGPDADADPGNQNAADPDPQHWFQCHIRAVVPYSGELGEPDGGAEGPDPVPSEAALLPGHPGHLRGDDGGRTAGRWKVQARGLQVSTPFLFSLSPKSGHNILSGLLQGSRIRIHLIRIRILGFDDQKLCMKARQGLSIDTVQLLTPLFCGWTIPLSDSNVNNVNPMCTVCFGIYV